MPRSQGDRPQTPGGSSCCPPGGASGERHTAGDTLGTPLSPCCPRHPLTHTPLAEGPPFPRGHTGPPPSPAAPPGPSRCAQHPQLPAAHLSTLGTISSCSPPNRVGFGASLPTPPLQGPQSWSWSPPRSCSSGSLVCFWCLLPLKSPGTQLLAGGHSQGRMKGAPWGLSPLPPSPTPPGADSAPPGGSPQLLNGLRWGGQSLVVPTAPTWDISTPPAPRALQPPHHTGGQPGPSLGQPHSSSLINPWGSCWVFPQP